MKPSVALIGAGAWGKNHLRELARMKRLHSVIEPADSVVDPLQQDYPWVTFHSDDQRIVEDPAVEAVVISVPAIDHYRLTKRYLQAGKDVFVEKPLALRAEEGQELVDLARNTEKILMVGHILQYHPAVVKMHDLVKNGDLGSIRYIYSNRLNIGKLRTEENVLWSFAPHDISVMLTLVDESEPVKIAAYGGAYISGEVFDTTLTVMDFCCGVKGHIFVSWLHPYKEQRLVVVGSKKMAVFNDLAEEKLLIYPHTIEVSPGHIPILHKADYIAVPFESRQPLVAELEHFFQCLETRKTPRTDGCEGVRVLKVLERAEQQLRERS